MMNSDYCGNCGNTGLDHRGRHCDCNQRPWEDATPALPEVDLEAEAAWFCKRFGTD